MTQMLPLVDGWFFKRRNPELPLERDFQTPDGWHTAQVPGTVHQDLLAHGLIPDPFHALNELEVQWVGETDWLYRLEFEVPDTPGGQAILQLDGLDTFAKVWLNEQPILESTNMFVPHSVPVRDQLRQGRNHMRILFESALRRGRQLEVENGGPTALWNGDSSRLQVRKAQYHYGWDWGPMLMTAGIWRGLRLGFFEARIRDVNAPIEVSDDLSRSVVRVEVGLEGEFEAATIRLELREPDGSSVGVAVIPASKALEHSLEVHNPRLWWPHGFGEQALYTLEVALEKHGVTLDTMTRKLGARRLRLVQEPIEHETGSSFYFEINNLPIYAGGANWIPDDSFLPRITRDRYRERVAQAHDANMLMLRVWGGGIYEDDAFYDACDELGVLVWQDFMFACGMYPAHEAFLTTVKLEAEANIRRLRHHPSLALWCGNNEDYQIAHSLGAHDPSASAAQNPDFPARAIYEGLLPQVLNKLDPTRPYTPGSPFGGLDPDDSTQGDKHVWSVWHREMNPIERYPALEGRFVSEFGMQSAPALETIHAFADPKDREPHSRVLEHHNKASDGYRRLAVYLSDSLPMPSTLPDWVYATQFVQAEAMLRAYQGWRRRWHGPGRYAVGGALVWQLNDCWPVTSWAVVDSNGLPKPAYFVIARELAPVALGLERTIAGVQIWAVNGTLDTLELTLEMRTLTLAGRELRREHRDVRLEPNRSTELGAWTASLENGEATVNAARLLDGQAVRARAAAWPEPFKHHHFPDPELSMARVEGGLNLRVTKPAKGVWLQAPGVRWVENHLDLIPGEERVLKVTDPGRVVSARWLGGQREFALEPDGD